MSDRTLSNPYNSPSSRNANISAQDETAAVLDQIEEQARQQAAQQATLLAAAATQDPQQSKIGQAVNAGRSAVKTFKTLKNIGLVVGNPLFWPIVGVIVVSVLGIIFIAVGFSKLQDSTGVNITDLCQKLGETCMDQIVQQSGQALRNSSI